MGEEEIMAGDKWEYWVELRPKSKKITASLFNLKSPKSKIITAKEPTLRLKAFSKGEATAHPRDQKSTDP